MPVESPMPARPKRPEPLRIDPYRARVIRGPREDGAWYWRVETYDQGDGGATSRGAGWWTRKGAIEAIHGFIRAGEPAAPKRRRQSDTVSASTIRTVRDLLEVWVAAMEDRPDLRPHTLLHYQGAARRLVDVIGDWALAAVGPDASTDTARMMLRRGAAHSTVRVTVNVMASVWVWGVDRGLCRAVRWRVPQLPDAPRSSRYTPSAEDVRRVLLALPAELRGVVTVQASTGMRISEVLALTAGDVDLEAQVLVVRDGKTGARRVSYPPGIAGLLAGLARDRDPTERLYRATVNSVNNALARACKAVGVPRWTSHAHRRLAVQLMYRGGADVGAVASQLGHSEATALRHYREVTDADRQRAVAIGGLDLEAVGEASVIPIGRPRR